MEALKYAIEKTAAPYGLDTSKLETAGKAFSAVGKGLAGASLGYFAFKQIKDKIQNDTRRKALIEDLHMNDPIISQADKDEVLQYYATIYQIAPKLSLEKNTVKELLQNFIKFDRVDIQTIKSLADTEKSMAQGSKASASPMDAIKTLA